MIKERYLENNDHLKVHQIYDSMVRTPGEGRATSPAIVEAAMKVGVKEGKFGLGEMDDSGKIKL